MNPLAQFSMDLRVMAGGAGCSETPPSGQGKSFNHRIPPCPCLPGVAQVLTAETIRALGGERGASYYLRCLEYAQSLWREGKPAQAILQLNKAWLADLPGDSPLLITWPPPYRALVWMLRQALPDTFLGNPVRHFQHLASRVVGPRAATRSWRAWACFHLAEQVLPAQAFPRDLRQIAAESLLIPTWEQTLGALARDGWRGEAGECLRAARDDAASRRTGPPLQ
jgi:hypothetical protein